MLLKEVFKVPQFKAGLNMVSKAAGADFYFFNRNGRETRCQGGPPHSQEPRPSTSDIN